MGVKGRVDGKSVALGNARLMTELGLDGGKLVGIANARRDEGETVMFVVLECAAFEAGKDLTIAFFFISFEQALGCG